MSDQKTQAIENEAVMPISILGGNAAGVCGPDGCEPSAPAGEPAAAEAAPETARDANVGGFHPEAGLEGAASFADAESREILNLLGGSAAGGCCGGSCCS